MSPSLPDLLHALRKPSKNYKKNQNAAFREQKRGPCEGSPQTGQTGRGASGRAPACGVGGGRQRTAAGPELWPPPRCLPATTGRRRPPGVSLHPAPLAPRSPRRAPLPFKRPAPPAAAGELRGNPEPSKSSERSPISVCSRPPAPDPAPVLQRPRARSSGAAPPRGPRARRTCRGLGGLGAWQPLKTLKSP